MIPRTRISAAVAATALAAVGIGTVTASPASAADNCYRANGHWWCHNVYGATVYRAPGEGGHVPVGYMYTTTSWFRCRYDSGSYVGGPHPYRWEFTKADNGAWGWMKDTDIYSETNPLPALTAGDGSCLNRD